MLTATITSITNFILASEGFLLAGMQVKERKERGSAAWYWSVVLLAFSISALLGGIDHGFLEPNEMPGELVITQATWLVFGILTAASLLSTAQHFFHDRFLRPAYAIAALQYVVFVAMVLRGTVFRTVILNYLPVVLLLLVMNSLGLRKGKGSWAMSAGILVILSASTLQMLKVDIFTPLNHNGLYHVLGMVAVFLLYRGGLTLNRTRRGGKPVAATS